MKVEKKNLNEALRVIGKVVCQTSPVELYRAVRFVGDVTGVKAMATDGIETVAVTIEAEVESPVDFCVPYRDLKELIRINRTESMELTGKFLEFPQMDEPDPDVITTELPENFCELLANAAAVVDRNGYRQVLQGINLSSAGITATDGKQLLYLPCALSLEKDVTIPFPSALLALKSEQAGGILRIWNNHFLLTMNHFEWRGRLLAGEYPNWRLVIPSDEKLDYSITLLEPEKALSWVKMIPNQKTTNGVELNVNTTDIQVASASSTFGRHTAKAADSRSGYSVADVAAGIYHIPRSFGKSDAGHRVRWAGRIYRNAYSYNHTHSNARTKSTYSN